MGTDDATLFWFHIWHQENRDFAHIELEDFERETRVVT
jgi:hypothetical protein